MICFNCGNNTDNSYPLCDNCKPAKIDRGSCCIKCGYPQSIYVKNCSSCDESKVNNRSIFLYQGIAKDILRFYKFSKKLSFSRYFSQMVVSCIDEDIVLCPVPTSSLKRKIKSGYHLDPIIKYIKKSKKVKVVNLLKKRYSSTQKNLSKKERLYNLKESFLVKNHRYKDKQILLFDDVYTTGATLESCSSVLIKAGYSNVKSLTLYHD